MTTLATNRRNSNMNWFLSQDGAELTEYEGCSFITYINEKGLNTLAYFGPKSQKPQSHIAFRTIEKMINYMVRVANNVDSRIKEKKQRAEKAKEAAAAMKVGDVLNTSWGYEQTNVEFYQVIEKKGMTVTLQELAQIQVSDNGNYSGQVIPDFNKKIREPFKKRVSSGGYIKINSSAYASQWDGRPSYTSSYY